MCLRLRSNLTLKFNRIEEIPQEKYPYAKQILKEILKCI